MRDTVLAQVAAYWFLSLVILIGINTLLVIGTREFSGRWVNFGDPVIEKHGFEEDGLERKLEASELHRYLYQATVATRIVFSPLEGDSVRKATISHVESARFLLLWIVSERDTNEF